MTRRLVYRRHLRLAAYAFWGVAIPINFLTAFSCIAPSSYLLAPIFLGLIGSGIPTIAALGTGWALLFARQRSVSRRTRDGAGMAVFFFSILPIVTLWTLWPLHLAFMAARPAMDLLADQVTAGKTVVFPRRAGVFAVSAATISPLSSEVILMIEPNLAGPTLVRARPNSAPRPGKPVGGFEAKCGSGRWMVLS